MPNGQSVLLKCDVRSRAGHVFDMIIAHANLVEHFYFGLAYSEGNAPVSLESRLTWVATVITTIQCWV